jgi:hypothetical protein
MRDGLFLFKVSRIVFAGLGIPDFLRLRFPVARNDVNPDTDFRNCSNPLSTSFAQLVQSESDAYI